MFHLLFFDLVTPWNKVKKKKITNSYEGTGKKQTKK